MSKPAKVLLYYLSLLVLLTNCDNKEEYYARPTELADPVYQQLEARGNFKNFLALVDKANYKNTLSAAGYWTVFAPNDAAFQKYFTENGISGVNEISAETASQIVRYALVYNAFLTDRLDDYQANNGWVEGEAFKRRTAYYKGVYKVDEIQVGDRVEKNANVISSNRNGGFVFTDNNNKYIPYFMTTYFAGQRLSAADYSTFHPEIPWSNTFHVAGAKVVNANIIAENGIIHEIDNVVLPLKNIEEYLESKSEYSVFRGLFEKYMVSYNQNEQATERNKILTGSASPVYVKTYDAQLEFSPNDEGFAVRGTNRLDNEAQSNSYTIFAPKNDVLNNYINTVLISPDRYRSLDEIPTDIIRDFLNAHMFSTAVWPSKFDQAPPKTSNAAKLSVAANVIDAKILSNGMFYGTNKVQEANVFHTVYGKPYLDPRYSLMIRALAAYKESLILPNLNYTLFLISDAALTAAGFSWNTRFLRWEYAPPSGGAVIAGTQAALRLQRILEQHIVPAAENRNRVFSDLNGEGVIKTFSEEYIKYKDGKVYAAGNTDQGERVNVTGPVQVSNGVVYYTDKILQISDLKPSQHISSNPNFSSFYELLTKSTQMWDAATLEVKGTAAGTFYTYLIPTNEAIQRAADEGYLPKTAAGLPDFAPTSTTDQTKVANFIKYHIIAKDMVPWENAAIDERGYETLYKDLDGNTLGVEVRYYDTDRTNRDGQMRIVDSQGRKANVIRVNSNILSNRAIIHQIDTYLKFSNQ